MLFSSPLVFTLLGCLRLWLVYLLCNTMFLSMEQSDGLISPQRGLRHGDPISPFLFVLCAEGLSFLLNQASYEGLLNGIQYS